MRTLAWMTLAVAAAACNSKPKKREVSRFTVDVVTYGGVTVTVAGRPIELEQQKGVDRVMEGLADFKESEVPATTRPVVTLRTPCGPKQLDYKPDALRPPNEHNVANLSLGTDDLKDGTMFIFAPSVKGPVSIGDITVPEPIPRFMTIYDAGCGKPLQVGTETSPIERAPVIVVAPSTRACFASGVALYGNAAAGCVPASSERLEGKLLYGLPEKPITLFEPLDDSIELRSPCLNVRWLKEC